jgi:replication initiation and membrane attachment protein
MKFTKNFVESIASHWARLKIKTVKEAMEAAIKEERSFKESKKTGKSTKQKPIRTEVLPDWFDDKGKESVKEPDKENNTELEARKRAIEEKLKAFRK